MKKLFTLLLFLAIGTAAHATATATLQNVDVKAYKDFLLQRYVVRNGCSVQIPNEYTVIFSKSMDNKGMMLLLRTLNGARIGNNAMFQQTFTIIPSGTNLAVQLSINAITAPGTLYQKVVSLGTDQEINELNSVNNEFIGLINNEKNRQ